MTAPTRTRRIRPRLRHLVTVLVGLALLPVAVLVYRHGITPGDFRWPDADSPVATVDRYNGAWISGAFGLGILGLILLVVGGFALAGSVRSGSPVESDTVPVPAGPAVETRLPGYETTGWQRPPLEQ